MHAEAEDDLGLAAAWGFAHAHDRALQLLDDPLEAPVARHAHVLHGVADDANRDAANGGLLEEGVGIRLERAESSALAWLGEVDEEADPGVEERPEALPSVVRRERVRVLARQEGPRNDPVALGNRKGRRHAGGV